MDQDYTHPRVTDWSWDDLCNYAALAAEAEACLQRREMTYPDLVKKEKLGAEEAEADIAAWRVIAADWRWIAGGDQTYQPENIEERRSLLLRIAALDSALGRAFAAADRVGGPVKLIPAERRRLIALLSMRWWAERERFAPPMAQARFVAGLNRKLKAERNEA